MAISLVSSLSATPGVSGGTTASIDTTGANLLVVALAGYNLAPNSVSDSKSNSWTQLSKQGLLENSCIFYATNPTVGIGHTFTFSEVGSYPSIMAMAFSGVATSSPFDQENGAQHISGTTSIQTGSVTPTEDDELLVASICGGADLASLSIDSSFTLQLEDAFGSGNNMHGATAYKIQTNAGAENPTWSWTGSVDEQDHQRYCRRESAGGNHRALF